MNPRREKRQTLLAVLAARHPEQDRERLLARILCGEVAVNGVRCRDPKQQVLCDEVCLNEPRYVSRGGLKLAGALKAFNLRVEGSCVLDAGCSTGGFTDCLLRGGVDRVHAVDVARGKLDPAIKGDPRVLVHEGVNIRLVDRLEPQPDWAVCDLSFRSLSGVAEHIINLTARRQLVALVKPQFEMEPAMQPAGFDGVIRDDALLSDIMVATLARLDEAGIKVVDAVESPVRGTKGNREFFIHLQRDSAGKGLDDGALLRRCGLQLP